MAGRRLVFGADFAAFSDDHVAPGIINPERDGGESEDTVSKKRPDAYLEDGGEAAR